VTDQSTQDPGVADKAGAVAAAVRDEARGVVRDARDEASNVASEATAQAHNVVDETRSALRTRARQGSDRAAGALDQLGMRLRALADGDVERAGDLGRYAQQASERFQAAADRLGSRGFDGLVEDVQSFARRRPGVFLAVAAGAGFAAGRLFRGARAAESSSSTPAPATPTAQLPGGDHPQTVVAANPHPAGGATTGHTTVPADPGGPR
jgi:ElaB/YqjD/DUF883 family membrane-anchored ribosome-binding protein